ncbi:zincin [Pyrenochaeta sp. DS3sAY3a]|nr:zincin [Pyrenochaeta sp. DS3sAY3a]
MASDPEQKRIYPCITQKGCNPTYNIPEDEDSQDEDADHPYRGPEIVVGYEAEIPRWIANTTNPTQLLYFVLPTDFPTPEDKKYTAVAFADAAKQWNNIGLGVNIAPAPDKASAHFFVRYYKSAPGDKDQNNLAVAFFPHNVTDVWVYPASLNDPFWKACLMNTFLHEIGHIMGLRHEFALDLKADGKPEEKEAAQRYESVDATSVMSYEAINYLRDTDIKDVKKFYSLENGKLLDHNIPIKDYSPKLRLGPKKGKGKKKKN